ncbi:energy-coupling factor ABC transporter ATP-binding protein [Arthrobacter agilis]|uniref:ABC transporter ATP-binding protein n=1 Tax=Arthrobacter agilis TaxID=37921 RepID=UPI000B3575AB|nr:ATP-binding cassette domain-containing protein [Arthrobacter agilis]PPB46049.1 ABC transporter ATP-binding protein [Arthrobacter agilis]TPV25591.1 energy-coupling factor ABC transporter ATP-binding protein [Arthrobacter agilis]VDR33359.1 Putative HMP/thiamine import ATP-binding protein YkoD [Arthrobacter agilis]
MTAVHPPLRRAVQVRAREWGWRHAGRKAFAARQVDLGIAPGERVLLLGASGAGKSTLLHALAGVLGTSDEGEQEGDLLLDGVPPAAARGRAGLVLQDPETQVVLARVGDEVAFAAENLAVPREEIWRRVGRALDDVGLDLPLDHPTTALSGGQKQRLALAAVLAMEPGLLLLDEPTANLDPAGVLEVRDAVVRVLERTGATLVVVEHRVAVWADVVDRVIVLDAGGGILADGPPGTVLVQEQTRSRLAEAGVWVPGRQPAVGGTLPTDAGGEGLLSARSLSVARSRRGRAVVEDLSLTVSAGQALSITGPNGAGKSTAALTIGGLLRPRAGTLEASALLAGAAGPDPFRWRSAHLVQRIGTVFQEPEHQFLTATVGEELAFGPRQVGAPDSPRIAELAERLRLTHLLGANPFTLSGGEKRRLSVATMLATAPRLLILDEPTFGQDALTWAELVTLLRELVREGVAVLSVTHDTDFIRALGGATLHIADGAGRLVSR